MVRLMKEAQKVDAHRTPLRTLDLLNLLFRHTVCVEKLSVRRILF